MPTNIGKTAKATISTATMKSVSHKAVAAKPAGKAVASAVPPAQKVPASSSVKARPAPAKKASAQGAAKPARAATVKKAKNNGISPEEHYNMIATAAYFCAEKRGFCTGFEIDDWFSGEAQINAMLST